MITSSTTAEGIGGKGAAGSQLIMRSNTMQVMSSSTSSAKKKARIQATSGAMEPSSFQDSFQANPLVEPKTAAAKKKSARKVGDIEPLQHPLEIRFVMTDKDGQDKQRSQKQAPPTTQTQPQSQDTQGDTTTDQESQESSPTPDFERNADGKFRCSWPRCGKEFTVASRLTTHFRIHSGKPPYLCGYKDCQKAFHTSSSLSHHRVVHTDQSLRPYICRHNRCGATYTQLARLITHQRTTHSGMILFIPQESSSSSSPSHPQNQFHQYVPPASTLPPAGSTQDNPVSSVQPPTTAATAPAATISATGGNDKINPRIETGIEGQGQTESQGLAASRNPTEAFNDQQDSSPSSSSHSPVISASVNSTQRDDSLGKITEEQPLNNHGQDTARKMDTTEVVEQDIEEDDDDDGESDEMRQRKEAALTMASFREMAMLQHQRQDQSSGSSSSVHHHMSSQQPPQFQPNDHHYHSSDYHQSYHLSYREYPPDAAYHQRQSHPHPHSQSSSTYLAPSPSSTLPSSNGSQTYEAQHGEKNWKDVSGVAQFHESRQHARGSYPSDPRYYDQRQQSHQPYAHSSHHQQSQQQHHHPQQHHQPQHHGSYSEHPPQ
ncbi:hypothetical protein BGX28_000858 [Mortierella sp. GBA30]|nr:hypothetical protein BGX28_000858 [Mortierella sp. GBA30]